MSCAVCLGLTLAIGAGIAYGYNYSMAEWIEHRTSDVTVYVRRGQFGDRPELQPISRRSGDESDMFSSNYTIDYQDHKLVDDTKPLSAAWQKAQDTRNYADKLTKYSKIKSNIQRTFSKEEDEMEALPNEEPDAGFTEETPSFVSSVQFIPNRTILTNIEQSERDDPRDPPRSPLYVFNDPAYPDGGGESIYRRMEGPRHKNRKYNHNKKKKPDISIEIDDGKSLYLQSLLKSETSTMSREEFEDADYYNIFKPV